MPVAVVKKFGDDQAGKHAALLAYYGFLSLFPLLLVVVDLEPATSLHGATALELLGIAHTLEGDFASASQVLDEAVRLAGETSAGACSLAHLALIGLWEGDQDAAFGYARRAHAIVEQPRMRGDLASVATYSMMAHL